MRPISQRFRPIFIGACVLTLPWILWSLGTSFGGASGHREGAVFVLDNTTGYILDALVMLLPMSIVFLVFCRFVWWSYIPIAGYLGFVIVFARARWQLIVGSLTVYFLYCLFRRGKFVITPVLVVAPIVLLLFALKGLNRDVYMELILLRDPTALRDIQGGLTLRDQLDTQDFANYEYLTYIVSVVPSVTKTYTYFTQWLQIFTEPIPRIFWAGKPFGAPFADRFFDLNDYGNFLGLTPSLLGDGWMSYGWLGEIITVGVSSFILGRLHRYSCRRANEPLTCIAYCITVALLVQFFRDGGISIFKFAMFAVAPVYVLSLLDRRVSR
jgi:hypothetical protein